MTSEDRDDAPGNGPDGNTADNNTADNTADDLDTSLDEKLEDATIGGGFGSPVADRVYDLLAPVVATTGSELVDVQYAGGILRLAVERAADTAGAETPADPADGSEPARDGITTDALTEVNRLVSPLLDQHDPVPGRYTLEVSSPGVERPLRRTEHFARAVGEQIVVKTVPGHEARRFRGLLRSIDGGQLGLDVVEIDGVDLDETTPIEIDMVDVSSARTHFEWGPTPKLGGKSGGQGGAKNKNKNRSGSKPGPKGQGGKKRSAPAQGGRPKATRTPTTEEERGRT